MFNLLGTPAEHKRRVVYESSHMIPRNETIKEVVNWMEKYWGDHVALSATGLRTATPGAASSQQLRRLPMPIARFAPAVPCCCSRFRRRCS